MIGFGLKFFPKFFYLPPMTKFLILLLTICGHEAACVDSGQPCFKGNFINNKNKNYMVLAPLQRPLMSINIFNHPIKPVKLELMISISFTGKEIEASRVNDT